MQLTLNRNKSTEYSTVGELLLNNAHVCWTLEDKVRDVKIPKETAIPAGYYQVKITYSPRFKKMLPILLKVPNFVGVRIHAGNKHEDTDGCILVGLSKSLDFISSSVLALDKVFKLINAEISRKNEVWILVNDAK